MAEENENDLLKKQAEMMYRFMNATLAFNMSLNLIQRCKRDMKVEGTSDEIQFCLSYHAKKNMIYIHLVNTNTEVQTKCRVEFANNSVVLEAFLNAYVLVRDGI